MLASVMLVGGCNFAPRYTPPAVASGVAFKEEAPRMYASVPPGTWQPARPQDAVLKGEWWKIFEEPGLDALEKDLDGANQAIEVALQNFMVARAQVDQARAGYFPTVTVGATVTRTQAIGGEGGGAANTPTTTG